MKAPSSSNDPHETKRQNTYDSRESWLRAATTELRPYFESVGHKLPEKIRFAVAFPSTGRKGNRVGECWHASTSEDEHFEIIVRADLAEPVEVLGVLVHELVHAALPADAGHGKIYRGAAQKIGLEGKMRHALPGKLLNDRLNELAAILGPLPHARLRIERGANDKGPADRPKKQGTQLLKACECVECAKGAVPYILRITATPLREVGPPHCPKHGAISVELPDDEEMGRDLPEQPAEPELVEPEGV